MPEINDIAEFLFRELPAPASTPPYSISVIEKMVSERQRVLGMGNLAIYYEFILQTPSEQNLLLRNVLVDVNQALLHKDRLLKGINHATMSLLVQEDYQAAVTDALRAIMEATETSRVYLFENIYESQTNTLRTSQRFEITANFILPQIDNPELQDATFTEEGFVRWRDLLSNGHTVKGLVKDFPDSERAILEPQDIVSILVVPIFVDKFFWGFIGFDDCLTERIWTQTEENLLMSVANSIGNYISRKKAEKKLAESWAKLEQRVIERTEQLESSNKELESFAYSISHDLRAPLRHLNGYSQLLQKKAGKILEGANLESLAYISAAAQKMSRQIDDLLAYSRINKKEIVLRHVQMTPLIKNIFRVLVEQEQHRVIHFDVENLPDAYADEMLIEQAFMNLISNAIKYTSKEKEAQIAVKGSMRENDTLFSISDNGVGFNMEYEDRMYGVFRRLHGEDDFEGTGIGLANVKRIITRHKGKVWATGKVGEGATFYVSLPNAENLS
ncbi:MAG: ATP-binding protein [Bacteroidia bacterium]